MPNDDRLETLARECAEKWTQTRAFDNEGHTFRLSALILAALKRAVEEMPNAKDYERSYGALKAQYEGLRGDLDTARTALAGAEHERDKEMALRDRDNNEGIALLEEARAAVDTLTRERDEAVESRNEWRGNYQTALDAWFEDLQRLREARTQLATAGDDALQSLDGEMRDAELEGGYPAMLAVLRNWAKRIRALKSSGGARGEEVVLNLSDAVGTAGRKSAQVDLGCEAVGWSCESCGAWLQFGSEPDVEVLSCPNCEAPMRRVPAPPPAREEETDALAQKALDALDARKGEDINAWADRLARDVTPAPPPARGEPDKSQADEEHDELMNEVLRDDPAPPPEAQEDTVDERQTVTEGASPIGDDAFSELCWRWMDYRVGKLSAHDFGVLVGEHWANVVARMNSIERGPNLLRDAAREALRSFRFFIAARATPRPEAQREWTCEPCNGHATFGSEPDDTPLCPNCGAQMALVLTPQREERRPQAGAQEDDDA